MEIYYMVVSLGYDMAEILMTGYILYRFAKPFMENKKGAACICIAYFAAMLVMYFVPLQLDNFTVYGIGILSAFTVMCRIDRRNYQQKIFIAVTFFSLRWLSVYATRVITEAVYVVWITENPMMAFISFITVEMLDMAVGFAVMGISVSYIVKAYVYKSEDMNIKEMLMLITPSITGMTGYGIMQYYQSCFNISTMQVVSGIYNVLAFLHFAISIITIVVVTVLFQNIKARQEEKLQNELLATQIVSTEKHIEQVESLYQNIHSIRHDMANHILTLERLYAGNKAEEAKAYGSDLKAALSGAVVEIKSGNPVTDVILQELKFEAEKRGICFRSDFYYPADSNVNAFDISVILNNALQNAVENAGQGEAPYISILSYHRNNAYMIEISNSFTGNLQWDTESGLPVTAKRQKDGHGYGLANIRRVARKYSGDIVIDLKDGEFRLSIMLMME